MNDVQIGDERIWWAGGHLVKDVNKEWLIRSVMKREEPWVAEAWKYHLLNGGFFDESHELYAVHGAQNRNKLSWATRVAVIRSESGEKEYRLARHDKLAPGEKDEGQIGSLFADRGA